MDDRQQAGASQPSVPQDAPSHIGNPDSEQVVQSAQVDMSVPAEEDNVRLLVEDARAMLRMLPTIGSEPAARPAERREPREAQAGNAPEATKPAVSAEPATRTPEREQRDQKPAAEAPAEDAALRVEAAKQHAEPADQQQVDSSAVTQPLPPVGEKGETPQEQSEASKAPRSAHHPKASDSEKPAKKKTGAAGKRVRKIAAIVIAAILVVYGIAFSWNQWFRGDDAVDIQGVWQIAGTESTITITKDYLQLTPDVKYPYTIDTSAKTITFSFAELSGQGRYRFSIDRNQLAIIEGPNFSWIGNTLSDALYTVRSFFWWVFTQEVLSPGVQTTAERNQQEVEKQTAEAQKQAEEAQQEQAPGEEQEIEHASSSDYVLGSQLIKKAQAIKGIRSTGEPKEEADVELPTECTVLVRLEQAADSQGEEKPVMIIELRDDTNNGQSGNTQQKSPFAGESSSGSAGSAGAAAASGAVGSQGTSNPQGAQGAQGAQGSSPSDQASTEEQSGDS